MFGYEYDQWKTMSDLDEESCITECCDTDDGLELLLEIIKGEDVDEYL